MQRTGRSGHSQFRLIVQDSRFSPTRGRVVAYIGSYDPHTKAAVIDGEKVSQYLQNGAQPSDRVARLLKKEGIKLPGWIQLDEPQKRATRNPAKRRSTRPPQESAPDSAGQVEEPKAPEAETPVEETPAETPAEEVPAEETPAEPAAKEAPAETPASEAPVEETPETPAKPEEKPAK